MNPVRLILVCVVIATAAHGADAVDVVIAQKARESEERIAQLQRENDIKTAIIYSIGIAGAGACIAYGLFRGLSASKKNA